MISSLRKKYLRQCTGKRSDEEQLWQCLASCLPYLPSSLDYSSVPDFLLDVVGLADMNQPEVVGCIAVLLPLGCKAFPTSPSWPPTFTLLLKQPLLVKAAISALLSLNFPPTPALAPLVSRLSLVAMEHEELRDDVGFIAKKLLYISPAALSPIFNHLVTEDLEEKFNDPPPEASLLLACLEQGADPRLLANSGKDLPPATRLSLLALCSVMCGGPGPLRARTAVGAKLEAAAQPLPGGARQALHSQAASGRRQALPHQGRGWK